MKEQLNKINQFLAQLDAASAHALQSITSHKTFKKGEQLLRQDSICKYSYWIESGVARKYYLHQGKEITTELLFEQDLALSFESYTLQVPSKEIIESITDVKVSVVSYQDFQEAKKQHPSLVQLDLLLAEYYALWIENRLFEFHTLNATERYHQLMNKFPHYLQWVPLTHLASFLGISLETLSRIRAKL